MPVVLKIKIIPDAENRTLIIEDNGIGMNRDDLINHLGTIAKSGTAEFVKNVKDNGSAVDLIGQFGVGFIRHLWWRIKWKSRPAAHGEDKAWVWLSDGIGGFEISEGQRDHNGTSIKLFLKEDAKRIYGYDLFAPDYPYLFRPY